MKYVVLIMLLYIVGAIDYLGSNILIIICHFSFLGISICSFLHYISVHKCNKIAIWLILFGFFYPVYASIKSQFLFGQPIMLGIASLRYIEFIFFGYFLLLIRYDYRKLLEQINDINLCVAVISIVLILILGASPSSITSLAASTNVIETGGGMEDENFLNSEHNVRGIRFTACGSMMIISLIYYQLMSLKYGGKRNWIIYGILMFYLLFVHKGRQPVAILGLIYIIYYFRMKRFTTKKLMMILMPIILLIAVVAYDSSFLLKFTAALEGDDSKDFSTLARMWSMESVLPYIKDNPIFGMGNLSAHWGENGFQYYFGKTFFISDIGIIGAMATGGAMLIAIYCGIYIYLWKKTKYILDKDLMSFFRYLLFANICLTVFFFNDSLCGAHTAKFSLIFFPLLAVGNPNLFISPKIITKHKKLQFA